jgi:hypothetical protein
MRLAFFLMISVFCISPVFTQLNDDFSDGDFINNPTWNGDVSNFIINPSFQLQLNAPALTDTSYLSSETGILDFNSPISWEFYIKLGYSPSNNNTVRFYLTSDNSNLEGYLNGYFIRIGENGSTDKLKFYRQDGTTTTLLATGLYGAYGVNPEVSVKINRDVAGNWEILADSTGGNNFTYEGGATDFNHTFSTFSGVWCKYTTSNFDQFTFDDISITGNVIVDNDEPAIENAFVSGPNLVEIHYDEPVTNTAIDISNYSMNFGNGNPLIITQTALGYELMFNNIFNASDTLELTISGVEDLSGNTLNTIEYIIVPDTASQGDLLINELLFDPFTGGSDYVEIYNNSNSAVDIYNYFIADYDDGVDNLREISFHYVLSPGELVLFTEDSAETIMQYPSNDASKILQIDLPSFPNDSATVYLLDPDSNVIDKFSYDEDMHFGLISNTEGVSLEKINPSTSSSELMNWHSASESSGWGTPGLINSQYFNNSSSQEFLAVITPVFSPDNNGYEDVAQFAYQLNASGMVGNAVIYDNKGRLIKKILTNELLSTEGSITWDGTMDNGEKARVGIYMIYFETFTLSGEVHAEKKTVTLLTQF